MIDAKHEYMDAKDSVTGLPNRLANAIYLGPTYYALFLEKALRNDLYTDEFCGMKIISIEEDILVAKHLKDLAKKDDFLQLVNKKYIPGKRYIVEVDGTLHMHK